MIMRKKGALSNVKKSSMKNTESSDDFTLPTEMSKPSTRLGDYSVLLYGLEKIGKTTLAAQFPDALFLMTEPGGRGLSIYQTPITNWPTFKKSLRLLAKDKRFKTVTVDTVDILFKMCERSVCRKMGIDHPSDEDWGKGWNAIRDEFTEQMALLLSLGKGVILISHATEREIKRRDGSKYHVIGPTMAGQARSVIQPMVDIWCYYAFDKERRTLTLRGDEHVTSGVRPPKNFLWNGKPVVDVDMGESPEEAYKNFILAFKNEYKPRVKAAQKEEA